MTDEASIGERVTEGVTNVAATVVMSPEAAMGVGQNLLDFATDTEGDE